MQVSELMSRTLEFVSPTATVQTAARLMGELDVGALPVGSPERPVGVLTSRDLLYRICAAGLHPAEVPVRTVMSEAVFACYDTDSLEQALDRMAAYHVRRLLVRNKAEETVGWITLSDISRRLLVDSSIVSRGLADLGRSED